MREYLHILKALLQHGRVDMDGTYYKAHESIPESLDLLVMASALQRGSFELCGAEADGAISWICPGVYLRDVALPAMRLGAERVGSTPEEFDTLVRSELVVWSDVVRRSGVKHE